MSSGQLHLETTLLNSFIGADSWAYVRVGDRYVRKKGRDLNLGDNVVVNNEGIDKTLQDVEPALRESMRYVLAERELHTENSQGQLIKNLRIFLLKGLAKSSPDLDARVMLEGGHDFSQAEYAAFLDRVSAVVGVGRSAVGRWLHGDTLAPADWENFRRLAAINTEFLPIASSYGQDTGFHAAYELFTGLRRTIMHTLGRRTGEKGGESSGAGGGGPSGKYAPEIEMVVKKFLSEVDDTKSAGRITKILPVHPEGSRRGIRATPNPNLSKGVYDGTLDAPLMDMNEVRDAHYVLQNVVGDGVNQYLLMRVDSITDNKRAMVTLMMVTYALTRLTPYAPLEKKVLEENQRTLVHSLHIPRDAVERIMREEHQLFLAALAKGEVDRAAGVQPNTLANAIDLLTQYRSAMPAAYLERTAVSIEAKMVEAYLDHFNKNHAPRKERREAERQLTALQEREQRLIDYAKKTYGISEHMRKFFITVHGEHRGSAQISEHREETDDQLRESRRQLVQQGYRFYQRHEVEEMLSRMGIGGAIRFLNEKTFLR